MIKIIEFYFKIVLKFFNQVLQRFEISDGLGFGSFLLGCALFVVFVNLLKFQFSTNGFSELKRYSDERYVPKHIGGKHVRGGR